MKKLPKKPLQVDTVTVRRLTEDDLVRVVGGFRIQTHTCACQTAH
jgi:hypothetical protein